MNIRKVENSDQQNKEHGQNKIILIADCIQRMECFFWNFELLGLKNQYLDYLISLVEMHQYQYIIIDTMSQLQSFSNYLPLDCTRHLLDELIEDHEKQNTPSAKFTALTTPLQQTNLIFSQKIQAPTFVLTSQSNFPHETRRQQNEGLKYAEVKIQKNDSHIRDDAGKNTQAMLSIDCRSKAQLVREIQLQIQLLESKSKQPGIKGNDLQPLGHEIYEKIDQYYIRHGAYKNRKKQLQITSNSFLNKINQFATQELSEKVKRQNQKSPSALSDSSTMKNKVWVSRLAATQEDEIFDSRKVFKTCENMDFSVSSISQKSKINEQIPFFQTKMSESDLAALDKPFDVNMEAEVEVQNESYLQLKENIRVMEERIMFLIHRLDETKTQLNEVKQENMDLQQKLKKESRSVKQLKNELQILYVLQEKNIQEIDKLQMELQKARNKVQEIEKLFVGEQKYNEELKNQIECLQAEIRQNQKKILQVQSTLKTKIEELNQLSTSYRQAQEEEESYRKQMLAKIQEKQIQNNRLKRTIKDYRSRVQVEGLSLKLEEAQKLKQLIEERQALHEKQLRKIDEQYSKIIESLKAELEKHVLLKQQLESALLEYLGLRNKKMIQSQNTVCLDQGDIVGFKELEGKDFAGYFIFFVNKYKQMQKEVQAQKAIVGKYEDRIEILKQDSQEKFIANKQLIISLEKKNTEVDELSKENEELKRYLRQNLTNNMKKRQKEKQQKYNCNSMRKSKIQSRTIHINLVKPILIDQSQLTLQNFIQKKVLANTTAIIKFVIKLISFSEELQQTHKRKLPSIAPHSVLLRVKKLKDLDVIFSVIAKKQQEEGLIYQAPQILLGFSQSAQSHCWTVGVIFDEMLHGRKFFKSFANILSHKDNYWIEDQKFKSIQVLSHMLRKNHKQRKSLYQVKQWLQQSLNEKFKK